MAHKIKNRFATIKNADGKRDLAERTVRDGSVIWVNCEMPNVVLAEGKTARGADAAFKALNAALDIKFRGYGEHSLSL